ncbi:myomegalin isoform X4 [Oncorhynchus mykiss]|uniref:myomegalin isoform X4 n=1 Tax=Oncorhynchus mykiss TaxID=8022 RepID=UPI0018782D4F|nr:myomegalin isoform X4 [Oncorhynchus mykiss]
MLDIRMKEACRICARELCGNQRRWIFHPASKLNLQVLLSHALGRELTRDGRGEFACSKCAFILERMYRFDTVVARVEALSIERLQRLLQEKHRLRGLIGGLYRKTNGEEGGSGGGVITRPGGTGGGVQGEGMVDMSGLTHAKYCALLQEDLVYSLYESWAEEGLEFGGHHHPHHGHRPQYPGSEVTAVGSQRCGKVTPSRRKCQGCTAWRVVDSDYEAVCKVPRKLARSISCSPSTRYSASVIGVERGREGEEEPEGTHSSLTLIPGSKLQSRASDSDRTLAGRASSSPSIDSLDIAGESTRLSAIQDGAEGLGYSRDPLDDRFSDSLSEEHDLVTALRSASHLSLALCLVQNCVYRPVQSPKGSRLPVLLRQSPSDGGSRLSFYEPALGLLHRGPNGEGEIHGHVPDVEAPLIRLDSEMDGGLDLAEMEELWEDLYHECPPPRPHQTLIEEQHSQLNQYECAAGQCISELQKAQLQVQSLQTKIQESEANNTKLQEKLSEMECDLRSIRQAAQNQEHTIQGLTDSVSTKDNEAKELYQLIEGQNTTLCKLREMAHHNQITQHQVRPHTPQTDPDETLREMAHHNQITQHQVRPHTPQTDPDETLREMAHHNQITQHQVRPHTPQTDPDETLREMAHHNQITQHQVRPHTPQTDPDETLREMAHHNQITQHQVRPHTPQTDPDETLREMAHHNQITQHQVKPHTPQTDPDETLREMAHHNQITQHQVKPHTPQTDPDETLREMAHHNQITQHQAPEGGSEVAGLAQLQGELVGVQSSLFTLGLELEASHRAQRQSQRQAEDLTRAKDRLHSDLKEALQHREVTDKHNQDLLSALAQSRSALQAKEAQQKESEAEKHMEVQERDKTITQLKLSLQDKESQLQEYSELLESVDSSRPRDILMDKLRERIKDRDRALERSIDEKFRCLEEREEQVRRLQLALREKERDLERLRCILLNNQETITSLDALVRGKELDVEQAAEAHRNLQWLQQQSEEREKSTLRERDTLINQLQSALQTHSRETQDLTAALLAKVQAGPSEVVEELKARLALKEKLFQELLSDRNRQSHEHQAQVQDLLSTISTKDKYIQDCSDRLSQVIGERTGQLQELHRQLSSREREMGELRKERERERTGEAERLQNLLKEKETFIQSLMQGQEESMEPSTPEGAAEVHAIQEELELVRKKEREAQLELSALRSALTQGQQQAQKQEDRFKILAPEITVRDQPSSTDHQSVLEQLVNEYHRLNNALRAEKRLYQSLSHIQTRGDSSSEKTQALLTELDSVQALRGQLEEVLTRTRKTALALERAAKRQSDFGELSTEEEEEEGDDEEGSTDEFSDSIEDDEDKLTAKSLASTKNSVVACGQGVLSGGPLSGALSQGAEGQGQQLAEQKRALEEEVAEMRTQLETTGCSSLAQMRRTLQKLQQENEALKDSQGGLPGLGTLEDPTDICQGWGQEEEEEEAQSTVVPTQGNHGPPAVRMREGRGNRQYTRPHSLDLGTLLSHHQPDQTEKEAESDDVTGDVGGFWQHMDAGLREQAAHLRSDLALSRQESRELQERLMVSEATVHAQAEQLKDYRELLTETTVEQDSKQVQVDLQDLGYETCGRSENEADREASSPEFDDLEMCTSLSHRQDYESAGVWFHGDGSVGGAFDEGEEPGAESLQQLVLDLRSQLTRCHKVIRGLQLRVRSLSTTSDYASSLERTPRKVNWAFEASPALSGVEDDEGWMSDSLGPRMEPKPSRELRELVSRVASLEAQLKSSRLEGKGGVVEEGKCATWPGKYNTLIQAQARELSHLRQRMREGRGVCHILTQHLGDTTKGFEELLRANDIDYYMGQSFREQLAQSTALAQRMGTKISGRDRAELHDDKMGHELLALRLSKELQQKDKIIESLHTKLQQRPDTPSSSHALSETTDQSDRTSFVSDECRTNEDLELCSDVDAGSEYAQEVKGQGAGHGPGSTDVHPSLPPSSLKSSSSCPNMLYSTPVESASQTGPVSCSLPTSQSLPRLYPRHDLWGQHMTFDPATRTFPMEAVQQQLDTLHRQMTMNKSFVVPHAKARTTAPPTAHHQPDHSTYRQITHHAFYPHQLGGRPAGPALKADGDLVESGALWDMENMAQPIRVGSSGYYSGNSFTGVDVIKEHLREVQCLRQHLEESIRTNERLRQQLEERLSTTGRDGAAPTNIYIQSLDSVCQLSNEIRVLKEENLALQARLQASSETCEEAEQLREVAVTGRARLKQAELEAEQWKEELRRLQTHSQEQGQQIHTLRQERQNSHDKNNRLQHEVSLLQQQLCESKELLHSLQSELQVYHRVCVNAKGNPEFLCEGQYGRVPALPLPGELGELLGEVRSLRAQLQSSVQENSVLKQLELHKHLEQKLGGGVHGGLGSIGGMEPPRTPSLSALTDSPQRDSLYRRQLLHDLDPHSELQGDAPDGSFSNRNGRHAIGHVDDYSALQQQVLEGRSLVQRMETALQACLSQSMLVDSQDQVLLDYGCVRTLLSNTKTLRQILEEAVSLLKMFWRAALPSTDRSTHNLNKEQCMKEEILSLRGRISEQEEVLQGTVQRLRSTSRTKESMEHFIVNQLSRTRDVLKKARTNLEKNEQRISSLSSSSSSPYAAEDRSPGNERPTDWSFLKPVDAPATSNQHPGTRKRSSQCLF